MEQSKIIDTLETYHAAVSLFRIHCHMALTVLEISHLLSNQIRISFNLANFARSPPAICLIRCCILSIDVLLSGPVLALEDGRRDGGLAIEKRERQDGGFGMEMMERRGGGFAMEKRERSVRQRFRIGREGRRAVTGSKSKSIYPSIKKATPH